MIPLKECLTSQKPEKLPPKGYMPHVPNAGPSCSLWPDGGEGMLDVLLAASNGKRITVRAHDPLMQPCDASYGISGDGNTAFIEMAAISGLPLVLPTKGIR